VCHTTTFEKLTFFSLTWVSYHSAINFKHENNNMADAQISEARETPGSLSLRSSNNAWKIFNFYENMFDIFLPTPVAARSKVWVWSHSLAGIADSNPAGGMDACLLLVLCVVR
jgi:hypothetical protein